MFIAVELLGPSSRPKEQTPPKSANGGPISDCGTRRKDGGCGRRSTTGQCGEAVPKANDSSLLVCSVEEWSAARANTTYVPFTYRGP